MRIAIAGGTGVAGSALARLAEAAGHEILVLSRSTGIDLTSGAIPDLGGCDALVDASGTLTTSAKRSRAFFRGVTETLLRAAERAGVRHCVALSIVGAAEVDRGYYAGKAEQERILEGSPLPWTIVRATQFFEFVDQTAIRLGPLAFAPAMRSQPIAVETVARRLLETASSSPLRRAISIAGPEELRMADLARAVRRHRGQRGAVVEFPVPGRFGRALRDGSMLPGADAELLGPSADEWLARADA